VGKTNNIIEINGKRYDASTGALLPKQSIDGLSKPSKQPVALVSAYEVPRSITKKPVMNDIVRGPAKHINARQPQTAHTLMRTAVKKPQPSLKRRVKAHGPADALVHKSATQTQIVHKPASHALNAKHVSHAQKVSKSAHVSRFFNDKNHIATPPIAKTMPSATPQRTATQPIASKPKTTADLLQHALEHATSHEELFDASKQFRKPRPSLSIGLGVIALIVILGVVASQSYTTLRMQVASSKAGFNASLPNYKPAGYSLGNLTYSPGSVGIHFKSNSDARSYSVTEKTSQWDSNTLREQLLAPTGTQYQTIESAGRTIFLDDKQNANWVNGGVWYSVNTNGTLNTDQLVQIAKSL
jgi:hypothetical protein